MEQRRWARMHLPFTLTANRLQLQLETHANKHTVTHTNTHARTHSDTCTHSNTHLCKAQGPSDKKNKKTRRIYPNRRRENDTSISHNFRSINWFSFSPSGIKRRLLLFFSSFLQADQAWWGLSAAVVTTLFATSIKMTY